jgi:hypothetical protein
MFRFLFRPLNAVQLGMISAGLVLMTAAAVALFSCEVRAQTTGITPSPTQSLTLPTTAGGTTILLQNPTRKAMRICNAGATNAAWICPAGVTPAANAAGCFPLAAVASGVITCFTDPLFMAAPDTAQWNGIAITGTTAITAWEYF